MDPEEIERITKRERMKTGIAIHEVLKQAKARREGLRHELLNAFDLAEETAITKEEFFSTFAQIKKLVHDIPMLFSELGLQDGAMEMWLNESLAPNSHLRYSTLKLIFEGAFANYVHNHLVEQANTALRNWNPTETSEPEMEPENKALPLDKTLEELGVFDELKEIPHGTRTSNCINNAELIITLGDLLARNGDELLKIRYFGQKSLKVLRAYIHKRFNVTIE